MHVDHRQCQIGKAGRDLKRGHVISELSVRMRQPRHRAERQRHGAPFAQPCHKTGHRDRIIIHRKGSEQIADGDHRQRKADQPACLHKVEAGAHDPRADRAAQHIDRCQQTALGKGEMIVVDERTDQHRQHDIADKRDDRDEHDLKCSYQALVLYSGVASIRGLRRTALIGNGVVASGKRPQFDPVKCSAQIITRVALSRYAG